MLKASPSPAQSKLLRLERLQVEFRSLVERYSKVQKVCSTICTCPRTTARSIVELVCSGSLQCTLHTRLFGQLLHRTSSKRYATRRRAEGVRVRERMLLVRAAATRSGWALRSRLRRARNRASCNSATTRTWRCSSNASARCRGLR